MGKAEATRLMILEKAYELMYVKGYQTTSIDEILATTKVTKGAFYYHFKTKEDMGLAVLDEILQPAQATHSLALLQNGQRPVDAIYGLISHLLMKDPFLKAEYGCPVGNFANEMAPWNPDFRKLLDKIFQSLLHTVTTILETGQANGFIRKEVNAAQVALYLLSGYWGVRTVGKLGHSRRVYVTYLKELKHYLNSL